MRRELLHLGAITLLFHLLPCPVCAEDVAPPVQQALLGNWVVERVAVDLSRGMGSDYLPDDPTLMGRTLTIQANDVYFPHDGWTHCRQDRWKSFPTTWQTVMAKAFGRPEGGPRDPVPSPADYALEIDLRSKLEVFPICEREERREHRLRGSWIALQSPDRLVMWEGVQTMLFLKRRRASDPISPSFPCRNARTPPEKAICSDHELASLDRSVALAFELTRQHWPDRSLARCAQTRWLIQRDRCGSDLSCLKQELKSRVSSLVEVARFGMELPDKDSCMEHRGLVP
jgi:hypothetical protein